jgi:hypothetical protein
MPLGEHESFEDGRDRAPSQDSITSMALARANYEAMSRAAEAHQSRDDGRDDRRDRRSRDFTALARANYGAIVSGLAPPRLLRYRDAAPNSRHVTPSETVTLPHSFQEQPRADDRPVRGVVTIQATPTAGERPRSVFLIAKEGSLMVDELCQPHTRLLELPLEHVAAQAVPSRDNMFHIGVSPPGAAQCGPSAIGSEGFVVVLRDSRLRDQWLQALESAGARVDTTGWNPAADTAAETSKKPPGGRGDGFLDGARPSVRWLR